jgi:aquaporin Z
MFGTQGLLGATMPGAGASNFAALAMEVLLTAGLVSTILGTASGARNIGSNGALAVGGYIALAGLWAAPISGASMNPVRSFAPDLIRGDLNTTWIYVVGPVLGAMIAVGFEWILKGKPTAAGALAARGDLK